MNEPKSNVKNINSSPLINKSTYSKTADIIEVISKNKPSAQSSIDLSKSSPLSTQNSTPSISNNSSSQQSNYNHRPNSRVSSKLRKNSIGDNRIDKNLLALEELNSNSNIEFKSPALNINVISHNKQHSNQTIVNKENHQERHNILTSNGNFT